MKYVFSVSKTYIHRGNHRHKSATKKCWFIYYYEDGFKPETNLKVGLKNTIDWFRTNM